MNDDIWIDKEGIQWKVSEMADHHLFSAMENVLALVHKRRREAIEIYERLDEVVGDDPDIILAYSDVRLDSTSNTLIMLKQLNTDAFGEKYLPHYKALMTEAAHRAMREPFNPIYDKPL